MRCTAVGLLHQFKDYASVFRAADVRIAGARRIVGFHGIRHEAIRGDAELSKLLHHFFGTLVAELAVTWVNFSLVEFIRIGVSDHAKLPRRIVLQQVGEALDGHLAGAGWTTLQEGIVYG